MIPTKTINLDFWRHPTDILHLVQGEADGRKVEFKITDNGAAFDLTGYTVQMAVKKPDGNIVVNAGTITDAANGVCEVTITSQVVAVVGSLHAELQILKEGQLSKSFRIVTKVAAGVNTEGIAPSVTEFGVLTDLITDVNTVLAIADTDLWPEVVANAEYFTDLAGDGRTIETVKGNADDIAGHIADDENPHTVTLAQLGAAADADLADLAGLGRTIETVKGNADDIADLAGAGRNTETVKKNADDIALKADADDLADLAGDGRTNQTVKANADAIALKANATDLSNLAGTGRTVETVKANSDAITNLAGVGRTTETVKANADEIAAVEAEIETARAGSATLADEIQKRALLARYVYEANPETYVTAVSTVDGTFTSNGHGLVNDTRIAITHNLDSFGPISTIFPAGMTKLIQPYCVVNATENTFQLATTVGGDPVIPTTTGDVTKFHFEVFDPSTTMSISNLPNLYRATVYVTGSALVTVAQGYLVIRLNDASVISTVNNGIDNSSLGMLNIPTPNPSVSEIKISTKGRATAIRKTQRFDYETGAMTESSGHVMKYDRVNNLFNRLGFSNFYPANGLVIEVYAS